MMEILFDLLFLQNYMNKVIYLKSLVKNFKPKAETFPKDLIKELQNLGIDFLNPRVKDKVSDIHAGKTFIFNHTEEFLQYAVDYSLDDKIRDIVRSKKLDEKI